MATSSEVTIKAATPGAKDVPLFTTVAEDREMMKAASYIEAFRPPYSWIAGAHCGGVSRYIMEEGNVGVHTLLNTPTELEISLRARAIVMEALLGPILP